MSLPVKTIATVATIIPLLMSTMDSAQALWTAASCGAKPVLGVDPFPALPCGNPGGNPPGNPEFQSCGIDVPVGGGAPPVKRHYCIHVPANPADPAIQEFPVIFAFHGMGGEGGVTVDTWDKHTEQGMVLVAPSAMKAPRPPGAASLPGAVAHDRPGFSRLVRFHDGRSLRAAARP
jgi:hypothetical protein